MASALENIVLECARTARELDRHVDAWRTLSRESAEPNVFYEPVPFLAALSNLVSHRRFLCLYIYRQAAGHRQLIGFFPFLETAKGIRGGTRCYSSFTHLHCYLCSPLLHREHQALAVTALLDWIDGRPDGVRLFGFYKIASAGAFAEQLNAIMQRRRQPGFTESSHLRALIELKGDAQVYLQAGLPRRRRKEFRRLRSRLEELGTVRLEIVAADDAQATWVDRFLSLEARGWKGRRGFAMDNTAADSGFFYDLVSGLGKDSRLILHTLWLDDKPVAMKCNLLPSGDRGGFAFKIAYDEEYARYSPGVLLELENIEDLFARHKSIQWMDSCADPEHPMIDHLWRERREIAYVLCGSRDILGRAHIALFKARNRRHSNRSGI
jgi:CelD/BcsL family acetyltransferase involved in cellulose biosynthesis